MQRATRSNADNTLVQVEDPEQIIRERCRSMAEQAEQGRGNPRNTRDSDGEEYSEAEEMNIWDLYVPDLNNTPLQRAIQNGMALNDTQTIYRIRCPLAQRVHRERHTHSPPSRRTTGSTHGTTSRLRGKLCSNSIRPTQVADRGDAEPRPNTTRTDHTTRGRHSLGQRQVSIKRWTHRKIIQLCGPLCTVCRKRSKTWECTATWRQRWNIKKGNAQGNLDAENIK